MEGLSALIKEYEWRKMITGIQVARGATAISHMFFANDSYIFCRANREEATHVIQMLALFEKASGQKINIDKSNAFFSRNAKEDVKNESCGTLRFHEANDNSHYLGLPNLIGRNKSQMLGYIKDNMHDRVDSWNGKLLSKGGKEILLKTVTQSIPNYAMNVFLLPLEICHDMEKAMARFWWKSSLNKDKSIHWMSWERICNSKMYGGLGFRNMHDFNIALLGKQGWRLMTNAGNLVARVYKSRYFPHTNFLDAKIGSNPSYIWRSVLAA